MKIASFLHFSDTHLGIGLKTYSRVVKGQHRSLDFKKNFNTIINRASKDDIDFVIHSGDVFDRSKPHLPTKEETIKKLYELSKLKPVFIIPGNHDRSIVDIKLFSAFSNFHVYNKPATKNILNNGLDISITGLPFFRDAQVKFKRYLRKSKFESSTSYTILMLHQLIENSKHGIHDFIFKGNNKEVILTKDLPDSNYIALGHVHRFQKLPKNVVYAGSTERTSFIERKEEKGYIISSINSKNGKIITDSKFYKLPTRTMNLIEFDYTNKDELDLQIIKEVSRISKSHLINCRVISDHKVDKNELFALQNSIRKKINSDRVKIYSTQVK